jgi:hypothetical protein
LMQMKKRSSYLRKLGLGEGTRCRCHAVWGVRVGERMAREVCREVSVLEENMWCGLCRRYCRRIVRRWGLEKRTWGEGRPFLAHSLTSLTLRTVEAHGLCSVGWCCYVVVIYIYIYSMCNFWCENQLDSESISVFLFIM